MYVTKLSENGETTLEQADKLKKLAAKETGSLGVNILIAFGVLAICGGLFPLDPTMDLALFMALALTVGGLVLKNIKANNGGRWEVQFCRVLQI